MGSRVKLAPVSTSFQTSCRVSTPRIHAGLTFAFESSAQIAKHASFHGLSSGPRPQRMNPLEVDRIRLEGAFLLGQSSCAARKFSELKENTASTDAELRLRKRYSRPATGRLELSASPGENGLQPVSSTSRGISASLRRTIPNGNRLSNVACRNSGSPQQPPGWTPSTTGGHCRRFNA